MENNLLACDKAPPLLKAFKNTLWGISVLAGLWETAPLGANTFLSENVARSRDSQEASSRHSALSATEESAPEAHLEQASSSVASSIYPSVESMRMQSVAPGIQSSSSGDSSVHTPVEPVQTQNVAPEAQTPQNQKRALVGILREETERLRKQSLHDHQRAEWAIAEKETLQDNLTRTNAEVAEIRHKNEEITKETAIMKNDLAFLAERVAKAEEEKRQQQQRGSYLKKGVVFGLLASGGLTTALHYGAFDHLIGPHFQANVKDYGITVLNTVGLRLLSEDEKQKSALNTRRLLGYNKKPAANTLQTQQLLGENEGFRQQLAENLWGYGITVLNTVGLTPLSEHEKLKKSRDLEIQKLLGDKKELRQQLFAVIMEANTNIQNLIQERDVAINNQETSAKTARQKEEELKGINEKSEAELKKIVLEVQKLLRENEGLRQQLAALIVEKEAKIQKLEQENQELSKNGEISKETVKENKAEIEELKQEVDSLTSWNTAVSSVVGAAAFGVGWGASSFFGGASVHHGAELIGKLVLESSKSL